MKYFIEITIEEYYILTIYFKTEKEMWKNIETIQKQAKDTNGQMYVSMFGCLIKGSEEEKLLND